MLEHLPAKLRARIKVEASCWIWQGAKTSAGRPNMREDGRNWLVYRYIHQMLVGPVSEDAVSIHACDNPLCVNPEHIRFGAQAENIADCHAKRRHNYGERHWRTTLTAEQVRAIRADQRSYSRLAAEYGLTTNGIGGIKRRERWAWLD